MKNLILVICLLTSFASMADSSSVKIRGFTDLQFSLLEQAIMDHTSSLEDVKVLSFRRTIFQVQCDFLDKIFNGTHYFSSYTIKLSVSIDQSQHTLKCRGDLYVGSEYLELRNCHNREVELSNAMLFHLEELGVERASSRGERFID